MRPRALAFDGSRIWVANQSSDNVTKLSASTGAALGTHSVGQTPIALAYDGANIWVANFGSNNVTKINASSRRNARHLQRRQRTGSAGP